MTYNDRVCIINKKKKKENLLERRYFSGILELNVLLKLLYYNTSNKLPAHVIIMKCCSCCYGN